MNWSTTPYFDSDEFENVTPHSSWIDSIIGLDRFFDHFGHVYASMKDETENILIMNFNRAQWIECENMSLHTDRDKEKKTNINEAGEENEKFAQEKKTK